MKIFITGSVGFIGFNLANFLLQNKKNKVYGIDSFDDYYSVKLKKRDLIYLKKIKIFILKKLIFVIMITLKNMLVTKNLI